MSNTLTPIQSITSNKTEKPFASRRLKRSLLTAAVIAAGSGIAFTAQAQDTNKRLAELEAEISALKKEIEDDKKSGPQVKPGTHFSYGGFIKADFIYSDYSDGSRANAAVGDDFLVPSVIPVDDNADSDAKFDAHAKTSRFWLKTNTKVGDGSVMSYIEMDFNAAVDERLTNQSSNGLRHAFLKYTYGDGDSVLAGQTWSTFFNTGALPETVDFVGPTSGTLFIRQSQFRWTSNLGDGNSVMLAAENPSSSLYDGGAGVNNNQYDSNEIPDLIARYNGKAGDFSYSVAANIREIAYSDGGLEDEETGFAVNFSGAYKFGNGDNLKVSLSHGNLGRYLALMAFRDGAIEADGGIDLIDATGGFIAYQHHWNSKLRSTILYAYSQADNPESVGDAVNKKVSNAM